MANSPSVTFIERDLSAYSVTSSDTVIAIVGYATKGPIGVPTLTTSFSDFKEKFGATTPSIPFSWMAAQKSFQQGNQIIYTRVAETEAGNLNAASSARKVINNVVEFVPGKLNLDRAKDIGVGTGSYVNKTLYGITFSSVAGTPKAVIASPSSGTWSIDNVLSQLTDQLGDISGFQEFSKSTTLNTRSAPYWYGFKATVNGANPFSSGSYNQNFFLNINAVSTMSSVVTDINNQLNSGTRGYSSAVLTGSVIDDDYRFLISVDGASAVTVDTDATGGTTLALLAQAADNALVAAGIGARCFYNGTRIVFTSLTRGATSSIAITAGGGGGGEPSSLVALFGGGFTAVAGQAGLGAGYASTVVATLDSNTGCIRITSTVAGASSAIAISAPTTGLIADITAVAGTTKTAVAGRASIESYISVTRDSTTRKITFSNLLGTTAPTVAAYSATGISSLLSIMPSGTSFVGSTAIAADASDKVIIDSYELGSACNLISVVKSTSTDPLTLVSTAEIKVYYDGSLKETFTGLSLDNTDDNFFETVINAAVEDGGSKWIQIQTIDTTGDNVITFPDGVYTIGAADSDTEVAYDADTASEIGTYDYKPGTDGVLDAGGEDLFLDILSDDNGLANSETNNFHVLIIPDNISVAVQDAAINLAESRKDFIYFVDPPFGLTASQAVDWSNGTFIRESAVNTSYAAIYWPWLKEYDADNERYIWCPPSVFLGAKMIENDNNFAPWYAPAGDTRGILRAQDIETSPSFAQRENLYGGLNCVNPIVNFPAKGIEIYGQKTSLRATTALNRVNVRRMIVYIKKLCESALNSMLFEPNNADSWQKATNLCNAILEPIRQDNGLSEYLVVIDETTNTSDVIAQNLMSGIIKLVPTGTIEVIEININVYKPGSSIA
jgi:hypothetical protein